MLLLQVGEGKPEDTAFTMRSGGVEAFVSPFTAVLSIYLFGVVDFPSDPTVIFSNILLKAGLAI